MPRLRSWSIAVVAVSALALAGCSSSSTASPSTTAASTTPTTSAPSTSAPATSTTAGSTAAIPTADLSPAGTAGTAPTVVVPSGTPPTALESADLITGTGAVAKDGDKVTVQYVLATYSSGKVIQSSWTSQPFSFTLGAGQVIPGWDRGVVGMQVGGRRELIIPPSLGYGNESPGAGITAGDTLVFVIDLLKIN